LELRVEDISCPGWTVTEANVTKLSVQLQEVLAEEWDGPTYIIYHLYDNSIFMAVGDDGGRSLPVKSQHDGQYHVLGDLSCATRQEFKVLFSTTLPLLRAGGKHHKVQLSPLLRYMGAPCCSLAGHITNRDENFAMTMGKAMIDLEKWLHDLSYMKRIKNFHVLNPNAMLMPEDGGSCKKVAKAMKKMWHGSSVHLVPEGYQMLAEALVEELQEAQFTRPADSEDDTPGTSNGQVAAAAPPRVNKSHSGDHRKSWVKKDDAIVHRSNDSSSRGRGWRGHGGHRGHGGKRGHRGQRGHQGPYRGSGGNDRRGWRSKGGRHRPY
jgi:hypothetical protein